MNYDYNQSAISKAILTSVFVGFIVTIVCLIYNIIFRESTRYLPANYINVSSLIFGVNFVFFVVGLLYLFFISSFKKGNVIFETLFGILIVFCIWRAAHAQMMNNGRLTSEFRTLLIGIILAMGIGIELVPFLFRNKKFQDIIL